MVTDSTCVSNLNQTSLVVQLSNSTTIIKLQLNGHGLVDHQPFWLQALQALAVVLRGAHDDGHPFAAQCRLVWADDWLREAEVRDEGTRVKHVITWEDRIALIYVIYI